MSGLHRAVLLIGLTHMFHQAAFAGSEIPPAKVKLIDQGRAIHYRGYLDGPANTQVAETIKSSGGRVSRLVIDSGGGDVNQGMDLAEIVLAHQLDVEVERLCASSCANYVFPAAKNKVIQPGAVVVWHGSAIQEGLDEGPGLDDIVMADGSTLSLSEKRELLQRNKEQGVRYFTEARLRQAALFKRIGVDERVTVMGQQLNSAQEWTLTTADMLRFGINNVSAPADYGVSLPADIRERGVRLLSLDHYPDYTLSLKRAYD